MCKRAWSVCIHKMLLWWVETFLLCCCCNFSLPIFIMIFFASRVFKCKRICRCVCMRRILAIYTDVVISVWPPLDFLNTLKDRTHCVESYKPTQTIITNKRGRSSKKKLWNIPNFTNLWYEVRKKRNGIFCVLITNQLHCNPSQKSSTQNIFPCQNCSLYSLNKNFINFRNKLFHSIVCYVHPSEMINEWVRGYTIS